ncbi:MAG: TetR/AcrR family transcriptional regulator [Betaproteobacteria bacterium]|nr:MAG: TetR/AcrR family transcriptional regulator [Betaproteobacteria bacterium]
MTKDNNARQHNKAGMPRREEFLAAALQRFSRVGFAATSTRDICRDVGLAHSAIYNYFPSKGAILRALEEREMFPMQRGAERILSEHARKPPLERLSRILRYTIEVAIERRDGWALFQDMIRHLPPRARAVFISNRDRYERTVKAVLQEAIDVEALPEQDLSLAIFHFFGIADGIARWYRPDGRLSASYIAKHATDFYLSALKCSAIAKKSGHRQSK